MLCYAHIPIYHIVYDLNLSSRSPIASINFVVGTATLYLVLATIQHFFYITLKSPTCAQGYIYKVCFFNLGMDIIAARREERQRKINMIVESIKENQLKNKPMNFKGIVFAAQINLGVSRRTASEYAELALFSMGLDKKLNAIQLD